MRDYTGHFITIGAQFACQSDRIAKVALQPLIRAINECSEQSAPNGGIRVNVVFVFPGQFGDFGVKEMQALRFSRKQGVLLIKVPVPESLYDSAHQLREFLLKGLEAAISLAAEVLTKKRAARFDKAECMRLVHCARLRMSEHLQ